MGTGSTFESTACQQRVIGRQQGIQYSRTVLEQSVSPCSACSTLGGQRVGVTVLLREYGQHHGAMVHPEHPAQVSVVNAGDKPLNSHSKDSTRQRCYPSNHSTYLRNANRNK